MGVIYSIACHDCKVVRDLDKFISPGGVKNREDALQVAEVLKSREDYNFRAALLLSFLAKHKDHACEFFDDLSWSHELKARDTYTKDTDFWT